MSFVMAFLTSSGEMNPSLSGLSRVIWNPSFLSWFNGSKIEECSISVETMWRPLSLLALANPRIARLLLSVPPEVKIISDSRQFKICAVDFLTRSVAIRAFFPLVCCDAGLPYSSAKYGVMDFRASGSSAVVAALSR